MTKKDGTRYDSAFTPLERERAELLRERAQLEADMRFFRSLKPKPSALVMRRDGVYEAPPVPRKRSFFDLDETETMKPSIVPGRRGAVI